ncbi:MAG: undecaprenyl/decaprenyl-phosphate alpha-N-acetylglucosaminyl 1-phosphate transferase [Bacteroidales bacterium]|nr:undecaprenyl/decaprenyl-phosphate alpha-N-acetylglucosaminyl 1-phosphate transferase [Bacteroidales bacterium]MCM1146511.1 undecaprenyl/decaprenyl-phosphate alpha-N-acetylglucosaminyl 1-phosphate transferase [Bacteroidales bacterium]MCM1207229.1 undecaprenyl/decaprenyl-phosphate alpha-N-acetylglucosaminyl 1-phosphate transferase [Bacillota bacterium]MCM1509297.1 undecaprenyl/decaprenyl-phosphate alpha-N-acetylglucosaminyl 1-phosphate transferase [Clostridium sp.]
MNIILVLAATFAVTLCIGMVLTPRVVKMAKELHLYDLPDSRKVHQIPIPRMGGVMFLPTVVISITLVLVVLLRMGVMGDRIWEGATIQHFLAYMAGAMMLYVVGLYDDIRGVGYKVKFCVQIAAAVLLCVSGLWVSDFSYVFFIREVPFWIGMPFTVLFTVYVTNAMNLIDGIDGLASGLSIVAMAVIAGLYIFSGSFAWALIPVAYLGVLVSFFYYNVFCKRDKTFMGDAGSLTLGFTLSFLVLHFWQKDPVWNRYVHNIGIIALSTLTIPLLDVVRVFASRLRDGRNPFLPDKNHIHHKLLRTGLSGRKTMVSILLLSVMFITVNYLVSGISQTLMIVVDMILFMLMHYAINFFIYRKEGRGNVWDRTFSL